MTLRSAWSNFRRLMVPCSLLMTLAAFDCADNGNSQKCPYSKSGFPASAYINVGNPASCPIATPPGGRNQNYSASVGFPTAESGGSGTLSFADANGNVVTQVQNVIATPCSGFDLYTFSGVYRAGTVAPSAGGTLKDFALNQIVKRGGGVATATVQITYQNTAAAAVLGPSDVNPNTSFTLRGECYQSDLVPPVHHQWYRDGTAVSGATGTTLSARASSPLTTTAYRFTTTDAQGRSVSATRSVLTTAGCGTKIIC